MDLQVVPTLDTLRQWLDDAGITFFECDSCRRCICLYMQNFDGIFDAKIDLINDVILFSALAEVKPSALLALALDLSGDQRQFLTVKAFRHTGMIICQNWSFAPVFILGAGLAVRTVLRFVCARAKSKFHGQ